MPTRSTLTTIASETAARLASRPNPPVAARVEDVRLRNFDPTRHRVRLRVTDGEEIVLDERFELAPEATVSLLDELDDGRYGVTAVMDGERRATGRCEVAARPGGTILVEMGNGVIAVSSGR